MTNETSIRPITQSTRVSGLSGVVYEGLFDFYHRLARAGRQARSGEKQLCDFLDLAKDSVEMSCSDMSTVDFSGGERCS